MTPLEKHHELALMILVGRSLPSLPWSFDEDREYVIQERQLWDSLTEEEKALEQAFLATLWQSKGSIRKVAVEPSWGSWTASLSEVVIPDKAFGVPTQDYRPYVKGIPLEEHPELQELIRWLWIRGYQVVETEGCTLSLIVEKARILQESDRLYNLLAKDPIIRIQNLKAVYDPKTGVSLIILTATCK